MSDHVEIAKDDPDIINIRRDDGRQFSEESRLILSVTWPIDIGDGQRKARRARCKSSSERVGTMSGSNQLHHGIIPSSEDASRGANAGMKTKELAKEAGRKERSLRGVMVWSLVSCRQTRERAGGKASLSSSHFSVSPSPRTFQLTTERLFFGRLFMRREVNTQPQ